MVEVLIFLFKLSFWLGAFVTGLVLFAHIVTVVVEVLAKVSALITITISKIFG